MWNPWLRPRGEVESSVVLRGRIIVLLGVPWVPHLVASRWLCTRNRILFFLPCWNPWPSCEELLGRRRFDGRRMARTKGSKRASAYLDRRLVHAPLPVALRRPSVKATFFYLGVG